jgi:hypothetical protein
MYQESFRQGMGEVTGRCNRLTKTGKDLEFSFFVQESFIVAFVICECDSG